MAVVKAHAGGAPASLTPAVPGPGRDRPRRGRDNTQPLLPSQLPERYVGASYRAGQLEETPPESREAFANGISVCLAGQHLRITDETARAQPVTCLVTGRPGMWRSASAGDSGGRLPGSVHGARGRPAGFPWIGQVEVAEADCLPARAGWLGAKLAICRGC